MSLRSLVSLPRTREAEMWPEQAAEKGVVR